MENLKRPMVLTAFTSSVTFLYGFIFAFSEKYDIITVKNVIYRNFKFVGIVMIVIAAIFEIVVLRRRYYDKYVTRELQRIFIRNGVVSLYIMPIAVIIALIYQTFWVEILFCTMFLQWFVCIFTTMFLLGKFLIRGKQHEV